MSICLCYHDEPNFLHERGVCYGTKEKEPCSCGGNPVMCDFYEEVKEKYIHRTHGDSIRAKTDEELAKTMHSTGDCPPRECPYAYADLSENGGNITDKQCVECWLDWLKQEAET